jgi:hypothetical protein
VVTLAADHPLRGRPGIDLDVLADAPWVAAPDLAGRGPVAPFSHVVYDGGDLPTLLALVPAGSARRCSRHPRGRSRPA